MANLNYNQSGIPVMNHVTFEELPLIDGIDSIDLAEGVGVKIEYNGVTETYVLNTSGTGDLLQKQ